MCCPESVVSLVYLSLVDGLCSLLFLGVDFGVGRVLDLRVGFL